MQGNGNDSTQDCKDSVLSVEALFEFKVLVPERMGQEIKSYTCCSSFEKP